MNIDELRSQQKSTGNEYFHRSMLIDVLIDMLTVTNSIHVDQHGTVLLQEQRLPFPISVNHRSLSHVTPC